MDNLEVSDSIKKELERFIDALRNSDEYLDYRKKAQLVDENEDLRNRIQDYRLMNYNLQQEVDPMVIRQKTEELERKYEELEQDDIAGQYLDAEMSFCRMMQEVNLAIYASMDIE